MYKLKNAFTLLELMTVMFIIGIVATITLTAQKPFDRGIAMLYQRAYSALATASYNIFLDLSGAAVFPQTAKGLCEALSKDVEGYINVAKKSGITFCSDSATLIDTAAKVFPDSAIQFISANGMRFYFSDHFTKDIGASDDVGYRFVFVDLNGDAKPNSAEYSVNRLADIVAFIVTDGGDVLPVGYPEYDKRYLTARVHYPDTPTEEDIYSASVSYRDAKAMAWGLVANPDELQSVDFLNNNSDVPTGTAGSNLRVDTTLSIFNPVPAVNTANKCVANTATALSPCEVEINQYYN